MLLSNNLSIGAFLYCNFLSFFHLCNLVLLSLHCISFHCIIFVHVCCMMFNKVLVVSISVSIQYRKIVERPGLCPGPRWGAYSAPQTPLLAMRGLAAPPQEPHLRNRPREHLLFSHLLPSIKF